MDNVDPIVKLLHVPTMTKIVKDLRSDMSTMTPGVEALMFAIYLAAITSMEHDEVHIPHPGSHGANLTSCRS